MYKTLGKILGFVIFFALSYPSHLWAAVTRDAHGEAELICEVESVCPGCSFWVAVRLRMDEGWHTYWKNPGDFGLATKIQWELPLGFEAGEIQWPYPRRFEQSSLVSYGYEGEVLFLTEIKAPSRLAPAESVVLKVKVHWLACQIQCIPGKADLEIPLPVRDKESLVHSNWREAFTMARERIPRKMSPWKIVASGHDNQLFLHLSSPSLKKEEEKEGYKLSGVYFFPERGDLIDHAAPQSLRSVPEGYELGIRRSNLSKKPVTRLPGVLVSDSGWGESALGKAIELDLPVQSIEDPRYFSLSNEKRKGIFLLGGLAVIIGAIISMSKFKKKEKVK
jgi:thiol:disulfide interchange protein DsbD